MKNYFNLKELRITSLIQMKKSYFMDPQIHPSIIFIVFRDDNILLTYLGILIENIDIENIKYSHDK